MGLGQSGMQKVTIPRRDAHFFQFVQCVRGTLGVCFGGAVVEDKDPCETLLFVYGWRPGVQSCDSFSEH